MKDFDINRSNLIVIINTTQGLRQCVEAILSGAESVDAEDLHIYVSKKVPTAVVRSKMGLIIPKPAEAGVISDETQAAKLFADIKAEGKKRYMWYVRISESDMRPIRTRLAKAADMPMRRLKKLPWFAHKLRMQLS